MECNSEKRTIYAEKRTKNTGELPAGRCFAAICVARRCPAGVATGLERLGRSGAEWLCAPGALRAWQTGVALSLLGTGHAPAASENASHGAVATAPGISGLDGDRYPHPSAIAGRPGGRGAGATTTAVVGRPVDDSRYSGLHIRPRAVGVFETFGGW